MSGTRSCTHDLKRVYHTKFRSIVYRPAYQGLESASVPTSLISMSRCLCKCFGGTPGAGTHCGRECVGDVVGCKGKSSECRVSVAERLLSSATGSSS